MTKVFKEPMGSRKDFNIFVTIVTEWIVQWADGGYVVKSITEWIKLHELLHVNQLSVRPDWGKMSCKMMEDKRGWPYPSAPYGGWCNARGACSLRTSGNLQAILMKIIFIKCLW